MSIFFKILRFFNKKEKERSLILFILIFFTAILDTLGIASIFPFISLLSDPTLIERNSTLNFFFLNFHYLNISDYSVITKIFGFMILIIFIFSLFLRSISNYFQIRFVHMREYSISKRILEYYLNQKYSWFIDQSSSNLSKNILSEVNEFIDKAFMPLLNIIAFGTVAILLIIILFYFDTKLTLLTLLIFCTSYALFYLSLKKKLEKLGAKRFAENYSKYKILNEVFNGIKQVKMSNLETHFTNLFSKASLDYAKACAMSQSITQLPRFIIEGIAFGGFLLLIILNIDHKDFLTLLPIISLFAFAGYRMLPAFQQIYLAISQIRYSSIIVDYMQSTFKSIDEFIQISKNSRKKIDFKTSIKLIDVNFKYKDSKNLIINGLNLTIPSKSKIGIIGPTGGGKTTLVDLIIGLLEPDSGEIYIDNVKLDNQTKYSWHKKIGYVAQDIFLTDNDIWQNVAFGIEKKKIDRKKVQEVCKIACLDEFINSNLDLKYDTIVGDRGIKLSGGQKQRIGIARSLYLSPSILVLDEGTSSLDLDTEANIISNLIKMRNNITVLMVAHRLNTLKQCDLIIEIKDGKILSSGRYKDIIKKKIKTK